MSGRKTILVTGATGAQGGSVARALLADGHFHVRALTRNPGSEKAAALKAAGAELATGDLADQASIEKALSGCSACFGVTNFWEHFDAEFEQGKNLIEAVAALGVRDFILSTLPPVEKATNGELAAPHFDIKAELETLARRLTPGAAFTHVAFYYENFLNTLQKQPDGSIAFGFPQGDTPLAAVSVDDLGGVVVPVFRDIESYRGKVVGIVGDDRPPADYAAVLSRVTGVPIRYNHIPKDVFAGFGFPGADDLANMFDFNRRFIPNRKADLELARKLFPAIQSLDTWAERNKAALTAQVKA
ncbi:MAG: NmrA-like family domain-containing 1 [bacterium]|nr:MAG: NmrA-like family domain-containing 1 [bacterium]